MDKPLVTIIAVTYGHMSYVLPSFIYQHLSQSDQRFKLEIWHDGPSQDGTKEFMEGICKEHPHISYHESTERQHFPGEKAPCCDMNLKEELRGSGWGHYNRAVALDRVDTDWVWFQNCDNQVVPKAIEILSSGMQDPSISILWWSINHNYAAYREFQQDFSNCAIDMCQFMIRTPLAKAVGFKHRCFIADGLFVEDIKQHQPELQLGKLQGLILGTHN